MRYFLILPFATLASSVSPALAQEAATPAESLATPTPPGEFPAPVDPAAPVPPGSTVPPPAEPLPTAPATPAPASPDTTATVSAGASASLTAEQKAAYDSWPAETKAYFDALTPSRQDLFLRIADADKAKLIALPASQQEEVWASLEKQDAEQKAKAPGGN